MACRELNSVFGPSTCLECTQYLVLPCAGNVLSIWSFHVPGMYSAFGSSMCLECAQYLAHPDAWNVLSIQPFRVPGMYSAFGPFMCLACTQYLVWNVLSIQPFHVPECSQHSAFHVPGMYSAFSSSMCLNVRSIQPTMCLECTQYLAHPHVRNVVSIPRAWNVLNRN